MSQNDFRFKQFNIQQDRCAMKVGTDGVLLGAWVDPGNAKTILDIGTGTGLLALMLAQKSDAVIHAIDIDEDSCSQANTNFSNSPWSARIQCIHQSIQYFSSHTPNRYDLIVSNPPYFIDAHPAPSEARNIARHMGETLEVDDLVSGVLQLLSPAGRFCVILPFKEGLQFREHAAAKGLFAWRVTKVKTKVEKQEKRFMMEFGRAEKTVIEDELVIQEEDLSFTQEYIELTKDFYLGLPKKRSDPGISSRE